MIAKSPAPTIEAGPEPDPIQTLSFEDVEGGNFQLEYGSSGKTDPISYSPVFATLRSEIDTALNDAPLTMKALVTGQGNEVQTLRFTNGNSEPFKLRLGHNISNVQHHGKLSGDVLVESGESDLVNGSGADLSTTEGDYIGWILRFTNGTLEGEKGEITSYTGATKTFGFASGFSQSPKPWGRI